MNLRHILETALGRVDGDGYLSGFFAALEQCLCNGSVLILVVFGIAVKQGVAGLSVRIYLDDVVVERFVADILLFLHCWNDCTVADEEKSGTVFRNIYRKGLALAKVFLS